MDTVEQLNGMYFYAGRSNLTSSELLFMIFCEKVVEQYGLGVADFSAVAAIVSGRNNLSTRGKIGGNTTKGTSYASKAEGLHEPYSRKLNSLMGLNFQHG